jgi:hypothetical protein
VDERRATSQYNLALPVEIRLAPNLTAAGTILVETRDISTHGFYFNIAQKFTAGTKFEFSIALPIEITGAAQAYINKCGLSAVSGNLAQPIGTLPYDVIERLQISR